MTESTRIYFAHTATTMRIELNAVTRAYLRQLAKRDDTYQASTRGDYNMLRPFVVAGF